MTHKEAVSVLVDHARGVVRHRYEGACPDECEGPFVRDPNCDVCAALMRIENGFTDVQVTLAEHRAP